ncbi:MAG: hypothetical protein LBD03_01035 [Methanobrevibacter sp.]|jgi:hypothetical protein|nr:hypothetical protein [Candidatus Methanovirga procula]
MNEEIFYEVWKRAGDVSLMLKKCFAIAIILLMAISCIGGVSAATAHIKVNNKGGWELYDTNAYNITGFKKDRPNGSAVFDVNFYNKTMYFNNYYVYPSYSYTGKLLRNCPVMDAIYGVRVFWISGNTIHGWWG